MLETKGGSIQKMVLGDVTNFGSIDLIIGDVHGTITVFSKSQILSRFSCFAASISSLAMDHSTRTIIAGGANGTLTTFQTPNQDGFTLKLFADYDSLSPIELASSFTGSVSTDSAN